MENNESKKLQSTKQLMGALVRMKPKPHEDMKIGKKPKRDASKPTPRKGSRQKVDK